MSGYIGNSRPSLDEIRNRVYTEINNSLPGQDSGIAYTPLNALAEAVIGTTYELYGYLDWIARQTNVIDCEDANLEKFGRIWGITRIPSSYSTGTCTFTGVDTTVIPTGTVVQASNGLQFITTADATISSGSAVASIKSLTTGSANNLPGSSVLTITVTQAHVDSIATVISLTGGADTENDTSYRARILTRIATPPSGGTINDYVTWAESVAGVTRAWVTNQPYGQGTVRVMFMMDNTYSNGIPLSGDITTVSNYISTKKPICADVYVEAPTAQPVNITIANLTPSTVAIKAAVQVELANMFTRKLSPGQTLRLSWIYDAIDSAAGEDACDVTVPSASVVPSAVTNILTLGTITYV